MAEVWKDIEGFPGYQVSNYGRVRTHNKVTSSARFPKRVWKDRILKQKVCKDRCCRVNLWKDGVVYTILVHRLVANEFCGRFINTNLTVNHKDGNRLNNNADNLEWMTLRENIQYGFENGQYKMTRQIVEDMDGNYHFFRSKSELGRYLNRSICYIDKRRAKRKPLFSADGVKYYLI
jgi:hypothetical protein